MTNPISSRRWEIASFIQQLIPEIPVYPAPPTNISAPCIVVSFRNANQWGSNLWNQYFRITFIGPAGDNESAIYALEDMLWKVAYEIAKQYSRKVEWSAPTTVTSSEQTYLSTSFDILVDLEI